MSSESTTVTIIGTQESRALLKQFAEVFATGISVWEDRLPIPQDEASEFRAGLRWSLKKQGFNESNSDDLSAMWQALDENAVFEGDKDTIELTYSAAGGLSSSWQLRLPQVYHTLTTLVGGSVNWALLTGGKKVQHLSETFDKVRRTLVGKGLDVTEDTPLTVVFFSPTDDPCTWIKHTLHNFGMLPNKKEIKGGIGLVSEAESQ